MADELYGPITILRHDGRIVKKIPWSAFKIAEGDWNRVVEARSILEVCALTISAFISSLTTYRIPIVFSNTFLPKQNLHYGRLSPQSKNFRQHGRQNATIPDMLCTKRQSTTVLQNSTNTILDLMRNRATYWALVHSNFLFFLKD